MKINECTPTHPVSGKFTKTWGEWSWFFESCTCTYWSSKAEQIVGSKIAFNNRVVHQNILEVWHYKEHNYTKVLTDKNKGILARELMRDSHCH